MNLSNYSNNLTVIITAIFSLLTSCVSLDEKELHDMASKQDHGPPESWEADMGPNGQYGYVAEDGFIIIDYQFERTDDFDGEIALVLNKNRDYQIINTKGEYISDAFNYINDFNGAQATVATTLKEKDKKVLINREGVTISDMYTNIIFKEKHKVYIADLPCDTCGYRDEKKMLN